MGIGFGVGASGGGRARASVRRSRSWRVAVLAALVAACGSGEQGAARLGTARGATGSDTAGREQPRVSDVAGAARAVDPPLESGDLVPLGARQTPRPLTMPRVRAGQSASFRFDGTRRGWLLRLPEAASGTDAKLTTAAYGGGRVFVGGGFTSHSFYGIDAKSGHVDWVAAAPDGGPTAAVVDDDEVMFNTESCTLFVVDARTGRLRWSRWLGDPLMSQPTLANGRVFSAYISNQGGGYRFGAFRARDGQPIWEKVISADVLNAPIADAHSLYFTTMDGNVWKVDQTTGRIGWKRPLRASSAPWVDGDAVHVTRRRALAGARASQPRGEQSVVLAKDTGAVERALDTVRAPFVPARPDSGGTAAGWGYEGSRPTLVDGRMYQTIGDEVHCRDARTGELLWRRRYTRSARVRPATSPAVAASMLVFGTAAGEIFALDIDTGLTAWAYDVGEPIAAEPIVADGWVYATTTRGAVVGLEVSDEGFDGWHMWGGNAKHSGPVERSAHASRPRDAERPGEGRLIVSGTPRAGELSGFPLEHTRVSASVRGFVASVEVEQTFTNPYSRPVEAVYQFPLPDDAAIDAMRLHAGTRVVEAQIMEREDARRRYEDARDRGVLATLLEQDRPNLFQEKVANVRPGDRIRIVLHYVQALPYESGSYRFVFPMVAGPRYMPASPQAGARSSAPAAAAAPPTPSQRTDRVEVAIDADMGMPIARVDSPTHGVRVDRVTATRTRIRLDANGGVAPDRDLDVRLRVAGEVPRVSVLSSAPRGGDPGYATLVVHPSVRVADREIAKRELVFVVDTSSSMRGRSIELAKAAMLRALDGARPGDTIRVIRFSDAASALSEAALQATPANIRRAKEWVTGLRAGGATEMVRGLRAALEARPDPERMRFVLLMTDGFIGNETDVLRAMHDRLGAARVFAFGVGAAPNRYLLTRVAELGRGDAQVVTLAESPEAAADAFHARIARPYLTDIRIDWGGLAIEDVYPRRVPDLFADRPLVVHGRYRAGAAGDVVVRGRIAGAPFEERVHVALAGGATRGGGAGAQGTRADRRDELASLWARTRISDLMTAMTLRPSEALRREVTSLGLEYGLLTEWTAFVAIDEGYRASDGHSATRPPRVDVPATMPAGVGSRAAGAGVMPVARARAPFAIDVSLADFGGGGGGGGAVMPSAQPLRRVLHGASSGSSGPSSTSSESGGAEETSDDRSASASCAAMCADQQAACLGGAADDAARRACAAAAAACAASCH